MNAVAQAPRLCFFMAFTSFVRNFGELNDGRIISFWVHAH